MCLLPRTYPLLRLLRGFSTQMSPGGEPDFHTFRLLKSHPTGRKSRILQFSTPKFTEPPVPWGVKLSRVPGGRTKSYSPVDVPKLTPGAVSDVMTLLVKPYDPAPAGSDGFGAFLCEMKPGDTASFYLKEPREIHGKTEVHPGVYDDIYLIGGGTGIAPLLQIARAEIYGSDVSMVNLMSVNRSEDDVLMREEIEDLIGEAGGDGGRMTVRYVYTDVMGRGDNLCAYEFLNGGGKKTASASASASMSSPAPRKNITYICGSDPFISHWCGPRGRDSNGKKTQGPLGGVLQELGLLEGDVYKF